MISTLIFIINLLLLKPVNKQSQNPPLGTKPHLSLSLARTFAFQIVLFSVVAISLTHVAYGQIENSETQNFTGSLLNDPAALDILEKIEQTRKMIEDLKQKEYESNQAQEHLNQMREISIQQLNHKLSEWERLWESYSSKNSFEKFVNKKPSYVQGVFWDQFEFKEQKVNAGKIAMHTVLNNGGTMEDAQIAYNQAAAMAKVELIEMNAQFNVNHNLANYAEQQLFNSTGQIHHSSNVKAKLSEFYSDYKLQPSYILANLDDKSSDTDVVSDKTVCNDGHVLVSLLKNLHLPMRDRIHGSILER